MIFLFFDTMNLDRISLSCNNLDTGTILRHFLMYKIRSWKDKLIFLSFIFIGYLINGTHVVFYTFD